MPITQSAKKALRGSQKKRVFNLRKKANIIDSRRNLMKNIAAEDMNKDVIKENLAKYYSSLDKAVKTNFIPKNRADRLKSRMAIRIAKASGEYKPEFAELAAKRNAAKIEARKNAPVKEKKEKVVKTAKPKAEVKTEVKAAKAAPKKVVKKAAK